MRRPLLVGASVTAVLTWSRPRRWPPAPSEILPTDAGQVLVDPAQLFERFYRGDSSRTASGAGSGIGLTIAKAIVNAHHGQLQAHSDGPGKGAAFEVTLPLAGRSR